MLFPSFLPVIPSFSLPLSPRPQNHCGAQDDLEFLILLPLPPHCRDSKHAPSRSVSAVPGIKPRTPCQEGKQSASGALCHCPIPTPHSPFFGFVLILSVSPARCGSSIGKDVLIGLVLGTLEPEAPLMAGVDRYLLSQ